jgi:precorrin-3B synthase
VEFAAQFGGDHYREAAAVIRGWCPGALRPMQSGDGLIVRLRVTGGILDAGLAAAIAEWSRRWGNGQVDLTNRANLQLRGVSAGDLDALQRALGDAGLLDADPAAEAIRNVIASPLAGVDPAALLDIRPVVAALEHRLAHDPELHALPGKFGFAIDDGGRFGLDLVPADVCFVAGAGPMFSVRLDGSPAVVWTCGPEAVPEVAAAIARAFLRQKGARRMRDVRAEEIAGAVRLVTALGACGETIAGNEARPTHRVMAGAGRPPTTLPRSAQQVIDDLPSRTMTRKGRCAVPEGYLGVQSLGSPGEARMAGTGVGDDERAAARAFLGVGLPFGRISADGLTELSASAPELRLTPWRAILVALPSLAAARALAARLPADAFILDPDDPRRRVAACPGAPACPEATTPTRADAVALAARLPRGRFLHVSGCAKGCAHPGTAPITLVGRAGRYDLIRDGSASAIPAIRGLTVDQVKEHLA